MMKSPAFNIWPRFACTAFIATCVLIFSGCATAPDVRVMSDPSTNFAQYQTFAFVNPLGTDRSGYQTLVSQELKAATQRQLQARGLRLVANAPQLLVNFNASIADKTRVTTMPVLVEPNFGVGFYGGGYYAYRGSLYSPWPMYVDQTVVSNYREGTLNIDIIDAARKQLVWEGLVTDHSVSQKELANLPAAIDAAVAAAFARYPIGPVRN
jgi:Domain of unknown function (DUF4136)